MPPERDTPSSNPEADDSEARPEAQSEAAPSDAAAQSEAAPSDAAAEAAPSDAAAEATPGAAAAADDIAAAMGTAPTEAVGPVRGDDNTQLLGSAGRELDVATEQVLPALRYRAVDLGSQLGRYQLTDELGAGGMATVYRARDLELRRDVAIKVLFAHLSKRREVVARFHREARAAAALDHPNIVRVYDTGGGHDESGDGDQGRYADPPYMVMELVEGRSLAEVAREHGALLGEMVALIGARLCSALAEAHRAGIVHRDVKPANVMVTTSGRVALTDFGVARVEGDDASLITRSGMLLGTPAFMSPEQAMGDVLDARSDIYSLGAALYQLATGSAPFSGSTARVMSSIVDQKLVPPLQRNRAMGAELARVIERMMAAEPSARYQRAEDAGADLLAIVEGAELESGADAGARQLADFFSDIPGATTTMTPAIVQVSLTRARAAMRARAMPQAMALTDRVLALDADCAEAEELLERLGAGQSRRRLLLVGAALLGVAGVAAAGMSLWPPSPAGLAVDGGALALAQDAGATLVPPDAAVSAAGAGTALARADGGAAAGRATAEATSGDGQGASRERAAAATERGAGTSAADARSPASGRTRRPAGGGDGRRRGSRATDRQRSAASASADAGVTRRAAAAIDAGTSTANTAVPPAPAPAPAPAKITVDIKPWCDLSIDGQSHGRARADRVIELAAGRHQLVCSQGPGRAAWRQTVELRAGERRAFTGSVLQPVRVQVEIAAGDSVRIGDRRHANGATLALDPGRYRVVVLTGERTVARAWVSIPAVSRCTLRDAPALDCYR